MVHEQPRGLGPAGIEVSKSPPEPCPRPRPRPASLFRWRCRSESAGVMDSSRSECEPCASSARVVRCRPRRSPSKRRTGWPQPTIPPHPIIPPRPVSQPHIWHRDWSSRCQFRCVREPRDLRCSEGTARTQVAGNVGGVPLVGENAEGGHGEPSVSAGSPFRAQLLSRQGPPERRVGAGSPVNQRQYSGELAPTAFRRRGPAATHLG